MEAEVLKAVLTLAGAVGVAWLTGRFTRKSQQESSNISLLTNLIDQLQEERDLAVRTKDAAVAVEAEKTAAAVVTVSRFRRYCRRLRHQIYELGGRPHEAEEDLDV